MTIHSAGGTTNYVVANIDSITFYDITIDTTAPVGMKLISAKNSSFTMGTSDGTYGPQEVSFTKDFYMDSTEVTQAQYNAVMSDATYGYAGYTAPSWTITEGVGDNYPVYFVNWYDAVLYCNARSKAAGKDTVYTFDAITGTPGNNCELSNVTINYSKNGFRLPTEAEWEYAARAGTTTDFYWGKDYNPYPETVADTNEVNSYSVNRYNSYSKGIGSPEYGTQVVESKLPNSFGLYDMSGNISEWCCDWFGDYSSSSVVDPTGVTTGTYRVRRGGSWAFMSSFLRSGDRFGTKPNLESNEIGFRVVCPVIK